jgi:hypothetical protein
MLKQQIHPETIIEGIRKNFAKVKPGRMGWLMHKRDESVRSSKIPNALTPV